MPDHARHRQAQIRAHPVVIVAVLPVGIAHDRLPSNLVAGDGLGRVAAGRGQGQDAVHHLRMACGPLQGLHPAQGPADHGQEMIDAKVADQLALGPDHVGDGHDGKIETPVAPRGRIDGRRPAGAHAAADDVGADHEVAVRVDGLAGPHVMLPPAGLVLAQMIARHVGVPGQGVADEHGVGALGVQGAVGLIGQGHGPESFPAVQDHGMRGMGEGE